MHRSFRVFPLPFPLLVLLLDFIDLTYSTDTAFFFSSNNFLYSFYIYIITIPPFNPVYHVSACVKQYIIIHKMVTIANKDNRSKKKTNTKKKCTDK